MGSPWPWEAPQRGRRPLWGERKNASPRQSPRHPRALSARRAPRAFPPAPISLPRPLSRPSPFPARAPFPPEPLFRPSPFSALRAGEERPWAARLPDSGASPGKGRAPKRALGGRGSRRRANAPRAPSLENRDFRLFYMIGDEPIWPGARRVADGRPSPPSPSPSS
jgi:hypothetical protein